MIQPKCTGFYVKYHEFITMYIYILFMELLFFTSTSIKSIWIMNDWHMNIMFSYTVYVHLNSKMLSL